MPASQTRHLARRGDQFYYRRAVPEPVRRALGHREIKISLHTADRTIAKVRVTLAACLFEHLLQVALNVAKSQDLKKDQFRYLVHQHYLALRCRFRRDYEAATVQPGFDFDDAVDGLRALEQDVRNSIGVGALPKWAFIDAKALLANHDIDPGGLPETDIRRLAEGVARATVENYRILRARYTGDFAGTAPVDPLFKGSSAAAHAPKLTNQQTLADAAQRFLALKTKHEWVAKTRMDNERILGWLVEIVGPETLAADVGKDQIAQFRDMLLELPRNFTKRPEFKGLSITDLTKIEAEYQRVSPRTAKKYMEMAKSFLTWCVNEEILPAVPGAKITITAKYNAQEARYPFTPEQLTKFLTSSLYTGCKSEARRAEPGEIIVRDGKFWIPLIGLFSGMRLGEIVQLHTDDIRCEKDIWVFDVATMPTGQAELTSGEVKKLKTPQSKRRIPVHPSLIEIGFLDYVADRRSKPGKSRRLFPDIKPGKGGYYSHNFSKWFGRYLMQIGVKTPKTVFHSLRHNFKDALVMAGVDPLLQDALMGHIDPKSVSAGYGSPGKPLPALNEAIKRITFEVDVSHLMVK